MAKIQQKKYKINMCEGPLHRQIIVFAIPLMLSSLLQLFFNAADLVIVGQFASHKALAAVGATASLTSLIINVFVGLSVGTNVIVARYIGENNRKKISRATHTSIAMSIIGGIILAFLGWFFAKPLLRMMNTPDDIIDMSATYMLIYFTGMPIVMLFNFGSAILRAIGDTKRPFYFLIIAGIVNVLLNMFFVIICKWDVGGVATATVASQGLSAFMILQVLTKTRENYRIKLSNIRIDKEVFKEILRMGLPVGFQGSCFSLANIMIQAGVNSFGAEAVAGNTAAMYYECISYIIASTFGQCATSFISQNYGGKQYTRIRKTIRFCLIASIISSFIFAFFLYISRNNILTLFNSNPEVIQFGSLRIAIIVPLYFICGIMEIVIGSLRGLGYSIAPTIIMIFGICVFRILWLATIFAYLQSYSSLLWSFPISWAIVSIANGIFLSHVLKKFPKHQH